MSASTLKSQISEGAKERGFTALFSDYPADDGGLSHVRFKSNTDDREARIWWEPSRAPQKAEHVLALLDVWIGQNPALKVQPKGS